jgi:hypothetical protein
MWHMVALPHLPWPLYHFIKHSVGGVDDGEHGAEASSCRGLLGPTWMLASLVDHGGAVA